MTTKSKHSEVVYIAGAYRGKNIHEITKNINAAREAAIKYWKKGYTVICPHSNSALMDGSVPDEFFSPEA